MMVTMSKFILKIDEALITILKKGKVLGTFCVLSFFFSFFFLFFGKSPKGARSSSQWVGDGQDRDMQ